MRVLQGILETSLYCDDLVKAEAFYTSVLGLQRIGLQSDRHVFFRCGQGVLLLFNPENTSKHLLEIGGKEVPFHGTQGPGHMAFRVSASDLQAWRDWLAIHEVSIEVEIAWPGGGQSIYFRDPAGNSLELATPEVWGIN